jgi:hypothetical protein
MNLSKYHLTICSGYYFNFTKLAKTNFDSVIKMRAWIIVYISFQLWTEFGGKFINQVKASLVKEFENDINFKKSESNTFLHWQKNLAICSLANTVLYH